MATLLEATISIVESPLLDSLLGDFFLLLVGNENIWSSLAAFLTIYPKAPSYKRRICCKVETYSPLNLQKMRLSSVGAFCLFGPWLFYHTKACESRVRELGLA